MNEFDQEQFKLMKEGKSYTLSQSLLKLQARCSKKLIKINNLPFTSIRRTKILHSIFKNYDSSNIIKSNFQCNFGFNISIGKNCYFNHNVTFLDSYEIIIGDNVFIAPNVLITSVTHPNEYRNRKKLLPGKVIIKDNVWIGAGAMIMPGVIIEEGAVVGAGSIVFSNVPKNAIVVGIPAKIIKIIEQ